MTLVVTALVAEQLEIPPIGLQLRAKRSHMAGGTRLACLLGETRNGESGRRLREKPNHGQKPEPRAWRPNRLAVLIEMDAHGCRSAQRLAAAFVLY
jgi:hypothetical protein